MQKHPCRECREIPGGQDMRVEPCISCPDPENYCRAISMAGVGSVPDPVADYRVNQGGVLKPDFKKGIGEILDQAKPANGESSSGKSKKGEYVCKKCNQPKPRTEKYFAPHAKTKDGLHTTCHSCMSEVLSGASRKKKPAGEKADADDQKRNTVNDRYLRLNFDSSNYKDLLTAVEKDAEASFRPLNLHILFILHQYIKQQKNGIIK